MEAREWEAEIHDALFPFANPRGLFMNADRQSGGGRVQGATFSHVGDRRQTIFKASSGLSMKDFRNFLNTGSELKLRTNTEVHLRAYIVTTRKIYREIEKLLPGGSSEGLVATTSINGAAVTLIKDQNQGQTSEGQRQVKSVSAAAGHGRAPSLLHSSSKKGTVCTAVSRVSEEDDEEEEDENISGRKGKGKCGVRSKPHIGVLSEVLLALDRLPPGLLEARDSQSNIDNSSPSEALRDLYILSLSLRDNVEAALDRATVAKILKPK